MCRYAEHDHKTHFVCAACRYSRKAPGRSAGEQSPRCPRCRVPMLNAGRDLKAPARRDERAWRALTLVLAAGLRFDSCGCAGPGYRPHAPAAVRARLAAAARTGRAPTAVLAARPGIY